MPSARMANDGELSLTGSKLNGTERFSLGFQALPWLETTFRYSHTAPGSQNYDRSFGMKLRLMSEVEDFADVSIGIRDLLGTGIYNSEYLAVSKRAGSFDFTAGLGWGRLSEHSAFSNPLRHISSIFDSRSSPASANTGGSLNLGQFFRGRDVGLFGGAQWQAPVPGLIFLAEFSTDRYQREHNQSSNTFPIRSPLSIGFSYDISDTLSVGAGWYYGSTFGATLSLAGDLSSAIPTRARSGPTAPDVSLRTAEQQQDALLRISERKWTGGSAGLPGPAGPTGTVLGEILYRLEPGVRNVSMNQDTVIIDAVSEVHKRDQCGRYAKIVIGSEWPGGQIALMDTQDKLGNVLFCSIGNPRTNSKLFEQKLRYALSSQGLTLNKITSQRGALSIFYTNPLYSNEAQAAGRAIRVLMHSADPSVELFHLVPLMPGGIPGQKLTIARSSMERAIIADAGPAELKDVIVFEAAPPLSDDGKRALAINYPSFEWSLYPLLTPSLFDPERPIQFQVSGAASGRLWLAQGLKLSAGVTSSVWDNINFSRPADSMLPHVRTDILEYLKQGGTGLSTLRLDYTTRATPELFFQTSAGYLEDMYMGAGAQLLWRPQGSRLSFGLDIFNVWKRSYDRLFGAQDYTTLTGHGSVYYSSPWYGLNFEAHAGRYLARDYGVTFVVKRRFSTGVEVGFFTTLTNVPFQKFGEGSFDKGVIIRFPLEWPLPIFTPVSYEVNFASLTRDGGQRLVGDHSLFEMTRRNGYEEFQQHISDLARP